jgi:hypothetical protein
MHFNLKLARLRSGAVCAVAFLLVAGCPAFAVAGSNLAERKPHELLQVMGIDDLSASDRELAEQLEIWPMLEELYDKQRAPSPQRIVVLRQKIRETILESYFDAAAFQAEAEREQGKLEALRQTLLARRDRNIEVNNATNFIGSGTLNTIGSVLGFSAKEPPFPGNFFQMMSGVVSTSMSTYALRQNVGGKMKGQGIPTVIAELFGRPVDDRTTYPESVWRFFHGKSVDEPDKSRALVLENRWIAHHELEPHGSRKEKQKLDQVSGVIGPKKIMSLDDLNDEINMITDISAVASLMAHHLRDLLRMIDSDVVL